MAKDELDVDDIENITKEQEALIRQLLSSLNQREHMTKFQLFISPFEKLFTWGFSHKHPRSASPSHNRESFKNTIDILDQKILFDKEIERVTKLLVDTRYARMILRSDKSPSRLINLFPKAFIGINNVKNIIGNFSNCFNLIDSNIEKIIKNSDQFKISVINVVKNHINKFSDIGLSINNIISEALNAILNVVEKSFFVDNIKSSMALDILCLKGLYAFYVSITFNDNESKFIMCEIGTFKILFNIYYDDKDDEYNRLLSKVKIIEKNKL
jgi:hypothetical protein